MAEIKTKKNSGSVEDFIASINDKQRQSDSERALKMFKEVTGEKASDVGEQYRWFWKLQIC